jgi:hypothetical protein
MSQGQQAPERQGSTPQQFLMPQNPPEAAAFDKETSFAPSGMGLDAQRSRSSAQTPAAADTTTMTIQQPEAQAQQLVISTDNTVLNAAAPHAGLLGRVMSGLKRFHCEWNGCTALCIFALCDCVTWA